MLLSKFHHYIAARGIANKRLSNLLKAAATSMKSDTPAAASNQAAEAQLRREKQALRKKGASYIPGTVNLQILGTGSNGAPSGVYLFTDQSRYLFNCGEGTQRLAHEHKTKLSRLEQIFVTRNTWAMVGGFPGLALTVQDAGVRELALHGPPYLNDILQSMKRFVVLKNLKVDTKDCTAEQRFEDDVMTVKCLPLQCEHDAARVVIAYICTLKPKPGALNLEKCVEQQVPPGPLLGLLKNGMDVTLPSGRLVKSKDVSEPGEKPMSFIFLDVPQREYLPALANNAKEFHHINAPDGAADICLVVHFSPLEVIQQPDYQEFVTNFPQSTEHIYLNTANENFSGYAAAHRIQYQLHQLNERIFPLLEESAAVAQTSPYCSNGISHELKKTKLDDTATENGTLRHALKTTPNHTPIGSMSYYHLRPRKAFDHASAAKLNPTEYRQETQQLEQFPALLAELQSAYKALPPQPTTTEYPKITFLGTGSCIPNKTRNVSAILVQTAENAYMLLDCGEGTLGQIVRLFGVVKASEVIANLHAIYISHLHADHHIGLIALLNERQRVLAHKPDHAKLLLFAPTHLLSWLRFYDEKIEPIFDAFELIGNANMLTEPMSLVTKCPQLCVDSLSTCLVRHCPHSYGISLQLLAAHQAKPVKLTYSGDTMPCNDLVDLGRNSTILIHEATMEDDLLEEAKFKMHSTISQAIKQGQDMQAEYIILTHFSQRYAKLPRMQCNNAELETQSMQNVAIAFDNMQVSISDLKHFHLMYPALRALFAEHAEELEQKAIKRELKLERKRKLLNAN